MTGSSRLDDTSWRSRAVFFTTYPNAALMMGLICSGVVLWDATRLRPGAAYGYIAPMLLLMVPGIAERSWKVLAAVPLAVVLTFVLGLAPFAWLNGRDVLPLTVHISPWVAIATPYYDDLNLSWQTRSMIGFVCYWVLIEILMLALRRRKPGRCAADIRVGEFRAAVAIGITTSLALIVYRFSWASLLSGTSAGPLPEPDTQFWTSLLVFALIFPLKAWGMNFLYDALDRNESDRSSEPSVDQHGS